MNTNGRAMNANDHAMNVNGRAMNVNGYAMNVNSRAHTGADPEDLRMRRRQMYWTTNLDPSSLGYDSESEGEVVEGPQLRTVGATCKANWPTRRLPTEAEWAT
ncbi:hypothetical protein BC826DRAFT_975946 [Russula brevipes]|nr:hypothetical protein BC826DRAFT_975946 [Russula brevipes]